MTGIVRLILVLAALHLSAASVAESLPSSSFAKLPLIEKPVISPDGTKIAAIWNSPDGPTVVTSPFGGSADIEPLVQFTYGKESIRWVRWANNKRLLLMVDRERFTYQFEEVSNFLELRNSVPVLYQLPIDGGEPVAIRRPMDTSTPYTSGSELAARVVSVLPDERDHILVQLWDERDNGYTLFKVDLVEDEYDKQILNNRDIDEWLADDAVQVVLGVDYHSSDRAGRPFERTVWSRLDPDSRLQELLRQAVATSDTFMPLTISGKEAIVLSDYETGRQALWRFDLSNGEFTELLFEAADHDLAGGIFSDDKSELLGVYYYDTARHVHYFDEAAGQQHAVAVASFPGYDVEIASRTADGRRMLVRLSKGSSPPKYAWLNIEAQTAGMWFSAYPELEETSLSQPRPIRLEARDDVELTGYLTLPVESKHEKPPLIVFPHDGPMHRDTLSFNPYVQYLANLGYAVLQVNFRGSSGFGTDFMKAGFGEWGGDMQEDIYDAVEWVSKLNVVDATRKCIVGFGYGGYAALVAAYQKPDDYVCIASIDGISDLHSAVVKSVVLPEVRRRRVMNLPYRFKSRQFVGDPYVDEGDARLKANSPSNHVDKIVAPLLLVHGTRAISERYSNTRQFYLDAKDNNVDVELLELHKPPEVTDDYAGRLLVFEKLGQFLQRNLNAD